MPYRRYEVLLPVKYNDGTPVEAEKFLQARADLLNRFGGVTFDSTSLSGLWRGQSGVLFEDAVVRILVDVPDTKENRLYFLEWKETLKIRFRQEEIWITGIPLDII